MNTNDPLALFRIADKAQLRRSRVAPSTMQEQLDVLEEGKARRLAASALGVDWNFADEIRTAMDERISFALFVIDGADEDAEHADLIDTQEGARF